MNASQGNLFTRDDTFFGVCEGLGQDLRINPNLFRVAFAVGVYLNPVAAFAAYFGLGILVLATRLLVREPRQAGAPAAAESAQPVRVENSPEELAMAA
jgi:phage shock protein PspC (stress-responsive transcriptional regulator)